MSERLLEEGRLRGDVGRASRWRALAWMAGAVVVLVLVVLMVDVSRGGSRHRVESSYSTRASGHLAFVELLRELGHAVRRNTGSYRTLPPPSGTTLVFLDPLHSGDLEERGASRIDDDQIEALEAWIEAGGHVLSALPGRAFLDVAAMGVDMSVDPGDSGGDWLGELLEVPGRQFAGCWGEEEGRGPLERLEGTWTSPGLLDARRMPDLLDTPAGDFLDNLLQSWGDDEPATLELQVFRDAHAGDEELMRVGGRIVALRRQKGAGEVVLVSSAFPFTNFGLARCGTAPAAVALVDLASEQGRREVLVDEYSHGLWDRGGTARWITTTSLAGPVLGILAWFLAWTWQNAPRLGPPREERTLPRRSKEEFVISLADVAQRSRRHAAAGRWLGEATRVRLQVYRGVGADAPIPEVDALLERWRSRPDANSAALRRLAEHLDRAWREGTGRPSASRKERVPGA